MARWPKDSRLHGYFTCRPVVQLVFDEGIRGSLAGCLSGSRVCCHCLAAATEATEPVTTDAVDPTQPLAKAADAATRGFTPQRRLFSSSWNHRHLQNLQKRNRQQKHPHANSIFFSRTPQTSGIESLLYITKDMFVPSGVGHGRARYVCSTFGTYRLACRGSLADNDCGGERCLGQL